CPHPFQQPRQLLHPRLRSPGRRLLGAQHASMERSCAIASRPVPAIASNAASARSGAPPHRHRDRPPPARS
ncbi:hypothetical protein ACFSNO_25110, partial [Streptomyces cirratus]